MELWELGATELLGGYAAREFTPVEVIDALGARIEEMNPSLGAFTTLCLDRARDEAAAPRPGPLAGVPFAAKDIFVSVGVRTTYGSAMFTAHVPERDAAAVATLRDAGAILVGKTQTHEFAWGITSVNEAMGSSRNPWDPTRVPGGSSGGSAVALAARMVPLAIGTDTGGSIRIPASFCAIAGLKPTYGRVSLKGVWPLAPSLDHAGPMARTIDDLELLYRVLSGDAEPEPSAEPEVVETDLSDIGEWLEVYAVIQGVEAVRVHGGAGLFPDRAAEYGADVRHRLERASGVDPDAYVVATRRREELRGELARRLSGRRLLATPVATVQPPRPEDAVTMRDSVMPHTTPQNLTGLPACAVCTGFDGDGLPTGVQITGPAGSDLAVLRAARALHSSS